MHLHTNLLPLLKKINIGVKVNKTMELSVSVNKIIGGSSLSFKEREDLIYAGLLLYIRSGLGEYLSEEQIKSLANSLRALRFRPADVKYSDSLSETITMDQEIRNIYIPRKLLRKDEAALLIYSLSPYALLTRRDSARFAKKIFPRFFGSTDTIYSTLSKFYNTTEGTPYEVPSTFSVKSMPDHTTYTVENVLLELGKIETKR